MSLGSGKFGAGGGDSFGSTPGAPARETPVTLRTKLGITHLSFPIAAGTLLVSAHLGIPGGIATLDGTGKLTPAQLPPLALAAFLGSVASQAAMLALSGNPGDWCVRSDLATLFILTAADESLLASWTEVDMPGAIVTSVAGRTGAIVLAKADVGLGNVDNTPDATKPVSSHQQNALNGKVSTTTTINGKALTGNITLTAEDIGLSSFTLTPGTTTTLGGVKRTTVPADNYVTGIDATGALTYGVPAGTGGGGGGGVTSLSTSLTGLIGSFSSGATPVLTLALAAPTTTVLGGVKRNAGTTGQFVTGIDTAGALTYDTPPGAAVGGGSTPVAITVSGGELTPADPALAAIQYASPTAAFVLRNPPTAPPGSKLELWITAPLTGDIVMTLHEEVIVANTSHLTSLCSLVTGFTYLLLFKRITASKWALVSLTGGF